MNNANYKRVSLIEVRKQARQTFRKDIKGNIALNIFPIIMRFIGMYFMVQIYTQWFSNLGINLNNTQEATEKLTKIMQTMSTNQEAASKYVLTLTPATNLAIYAFTLFFFMICIGISYALVDYMRNPDSQINALKGSLQVFSSQYFFPVIMLLVILGVFVEAGLAIYIIPGIWFMLMFSQIFLVFKDRLNESGKWSIRSAFESFSGSSRLMRGYKFSLLLLGIEFFFWEILNLMTSELLSIWLHPYEQLTLAAFYEKITEAK
ncbi:integral membrane protein [Companilactobacillus tucceti DSM 20183]|uniref:Integral membrane protein n=1 Tax=Companilactobacillus tucceti DSM 20183 TaxID=1423811 RepID=A0A0R1J9E7_9LACO|nr:DUF975 family protein [Companilactobacillus tucceti]KRK65073.1 integral membrane protein [Companilactobacillus tucceti DSM 20183]